MACLPNLVLIVFVMMPPQIGKSSSDSHRKKVKVEVYIDGPFGTPTRDIFDTEHAVLVACGIGVTPFASILQSVMYRYAASMVTCPHCDQHWYGEIPKSNMKLRRVDFIWINRDQKSFEWFIQLLAQLELQQTSASSDFLQMQMYMTSALSKNDIKGLGLQMALEILHKQENKDIMTGLKTRIQAGRPDWNNVTAHVVFSHSSLSSLIHGSNAHSSQVCSIT